MHRRRIKLKWIILISIILLAFASPASADRYYCFSADLSGKEVGNDANTQYGSTSCSSDNHWYKTIEKVNDILDAVPNPLTENIYILFDQNDTWDYLGSGSSPDFESTIDVQCRNPGGGQEDCPDDQIKYVGNAAATDCTYRVIIGATDSSGNYLGSGSPGHGQYGQTTKPQFDINGYAIIPVSIGDFDGWSSSSDETNCVTVENLEIYEIGSDYGIKFDGDMTPWASSVAFGHVIRWNKVYDAEGQTLSIYNWVRDFEIYENISYNADLSNAHPTNCNQIDGAAINVDGNVTGGKIYRNTVYNVYGECIGPFHQYNDGQTVPHKPILIEDNIMWNCRSKPIHPTNGVNIVRWNMGGIVDTALDGFGAERYWGGEDGDDYPDCTRARNDDIGFEDSPNRNITHHWVAYSNIMWGSELYGCMGSGARNPTTETVYSRFKYNVCIDNARNGPGNVRTGNDGGNSEILYNVGWRYDTSGDWHCTEDGAGPDATWGYNYYSSLPNVPACRAATDFAQPTADPKFETTSGYQWPSTGMVDHDEQLSTSITFKDLRLQHDSPLIDQGGNYTEVAPGDSGDGTTLIVDYVHYFFEGDKIAVNTPTNVATVSSINYDTNTIILTSGISRSEDDDIWVLPYDYGNRQQRTDAAYYGSAPDLGAIEFAADLKPTLTGEPDDQDPSGTIQLQLTRNAQANHSANQDETDWRVCDDSNCSSVVWESPNDAVNLVSINIPPDTLDPETMYYWEARTQNDDGTYGDVDSEWGDVDSFTTGAGADDYYFSTSGSDAGANNCETYSSPCKSIERANELQASWSYPLTVTKRILFKEGDTWNYDVDDEWNSSDVSFADGDRLQSYGSGTASNRLVWGAYDSDGNYVVDSSDKPVFDYEGNKVQNSTKSNGVIAIFPYDYITVENLRVQESDTDCIRVMSGTPYPDILGIIIQKNHVFDCGGFGIFLVNAVEALVTENIVEQFSHNTQNGECCQFKCTPDQFDYAVGLGCNYGCNGTVFSKNLVINGWGEAMGAYFNRNTDPIIYEKNILFNNRSAAGHGSSTFAIWRWNLSGFFDLEGDGYNNNWYEPFAPPPAVWPDCGPQTSTSGHYSMIGGCGSIPAFDSTHIMYGNLMFGHHLTNGIGHALNNTQFDCGETMTTRVFNNTVVDGSDSYFNHWESWNGSDGTVSYWKNNIGQHYATSPTYICSDNRPTQAVWSTNLWTVEPGDPDCRATDDIKPGGTYSGEAMLQKTTNWQWPQYYDTVTWKDFRPAYNSDSIDQATHISTVHTDDTCNGGTGCSESLVVTDSFYFAKNTWISVNGDITQVTSVSYGSQSGDHKGTLTISPAIDSRADGEEIFINPYNWYTQEQDQTVGFYGSGPDVGAVEYAGDDEPTLTDEPPNQDPSTTITLVLSRNSIAGVGSTHDWTDWVVCTNGSTLSNCLSTVFWSSYDDTGSKTSKDIPPDTLDPETIYYWVARTHNVFPYEGEWETTPDEFSTGEGVPANLGGIFRLRIIK